MHILYLVPHVPSPTKIRSHFQLKGLVEAGHRVTIVTLNRVSSDVQHIKNLQEQGIQVISAQLPKWQSLWNTIKVLPSRLPLQAKFMWSQQLMDDIQSFMQTDPPDVIHVEHLRMACYGLRLLDRGVIVWDAVDYLSALYKEASHYSANPIIRMVYALEAKRLTAYEQNLSTNFPRTLVISKKDQLLFQESSSQSSNIFYQPQGLPISELVESTPRDLETLVITGTLNYHPNIASVNYFIRGIFPIVQHQRPTLKLQLVGANPDKSIINLQHNNASIEITGFVPSIETYLRRATIALAPVIYGSGIQIKVLEAFLAGTPLVATSVALRGLDVQHEREVLIADTPEAFASAILRLLDDVKLREQIGAAGRRYVEENHDLAKTTQLLVAQYTNILR